MPFELKTNTPCKLNGVNVRSELHGKELVPAVDLKFTVNAGNDILNQLDSNLLGALYYCAAPAEKDQGVLDGIEPITHLPNLRFPNLEGPLKWNLSGSGYEFTLDYGLGGDSNVVIGGCQVNNFGVAAKEGGTVELSFRVQASDVDEHVIGRLATLVQHEVAITLTPPTVEDVADIMEKMESPFSNQADLDADTSGEPVDPFAPFDEELTPEAAFAAAVGADAAVH